MAQGGAAEAVAAQLEGRLRAALKARGNPFTEGGPAAYGAAAATGRPLLALFDRTFELRCLQGPVESLRRSYRNYLYSPQGGELRTRSYEQNSQRRCSVAERLHHQVCRRQAS